MKLLAALTTASSCFGGWWSVVCAWVGTGNWDVRINGDSRNLHRSGTNSATKVYIIRVMNRY